MLFFSTHKVRVLIRCYYTQLLFPVKSFSHFFRGNLGDARMHLLVHALQMGAGWLWLSSAASQIYPRQLGVDWATGTQFASHQGQVRHADPRYLAQR